MIGTIIGILFLWMIISVVLEVKLMDSFRGKGDLKLFKPSYFYNLGMNWFGAYTTTILIGIVSPFMGFFKIIKWLFTVGRKEK